MKDQAHKTWIVVADGGQARILLNTHRDKGLTELPLASKHDPRFLNHEPGAAVHHSPIFKPTEEKRRETAFVDTLAETVQQGVSSHACDGLILVAPANVMGQLRKALNTQAHKIILGEIVHDYAHQDVNAIYKHVKEYLPL